MKLIGISGTNGSGKDTIGHILAEKHSWLFVSVTEMLRDECRRRELEVSRENLRTISAEWRREGGLGVLIDKAVKVYKEKNQAYSGLAISSLRNPGESQRVKELGGKNVWVDADPRIRFDRIKSAERGRGAEDDKTYDEFLAEQAAEMHPVDGDEATLNMSGVKALADVEIVNDSSLAALESQIGSVLQHP